MAYYKISCLALAEAIGVRLHGAGGLLSDTMLRIDAVSGAVHKGHSLITRLDSEQLLRLAGALGPPVVKPTVHVRLYKHTRDFRTGFLHREMSAKTACGAPASDLDLEAAEAVKDAAAIAKGEKRSYHICSVCLRVMKVNKPPGPPRTSKPSADENG